MTIHKFVRRHAISQPFLPVTSNSAVLSVTGSLQSPAVYICSLVIITEVFECIHGHWPDSQVNCLVSFFIRIDCRSDFSCVYWNCAGLLVYCAMLNRLNCGVPSSNLFPGCCVLFFIDALSGTVCPFDPWVKGVQYCLGGTLGEP